MSAAAKAANLPKGNGELILVVDDEMPIRKLVCRVLEKGGYQTLMAETGSEAVELFSRKQNEIAAVVLDIVMPEMNGIETLLTLRRMVPDLPVLAMSGLKIRSPLPEDAITSFMGKPLVPEHVLIVLRDMLDSRPSAARTVSGGSG